MMFGFERKPIPKGGSLHESTPNHLFNTDAQQAARGLQNSLFPQFYPAILTQLAMSLGALGAIPTMLWLLIKGAKVQPLDTQASLIR
jgi:hypothetical protein